MWCVGELQVRALEQRLVLDEGERLGFGRVNPDAGGTKGWGYDGRFLELGEDGFIHRIWGELVHQHGLWHVRSLGSRHPVLVEPEGQRPIELPARIDGAAPHEFAVTQTRFAVVLAVAAQSFRLECATGGATPADPGPDQRPVGGGATVLFGDELAANITETEFRVLWVMSREYRAVPPPAEPSPLSYSRICRALELATEKQAVGAVERMMRRIRNAGLVPPDLATERQRDWLCRQAVAHDAFPTLIERYGRPDVD